MIVYGKGFGTTFRKNKEVWRYDYHFQIGSHLIERKGLEIGDSYIKIKIPQEIKSGTYDLYATYRIKEEEEEKEEEYLTAAVVIHINNP